MSEAAPAQGGPGGASRPSGASPRFDDARPVTVVLVRHAQTAMTVTRRYSGSGVPGPPLDETGRAQASAAAALVRRVGGDLWGDLADPSELVTSPMVRTRQTADVLGERLGLAARVDPGFAEADFGQWEGLTAEQIEAAWPGTLQRWHGEGDVRPPGGESLADVGRRVGAGLDALRSLEPRTVVVVSHAVAIRAALGLTLGTPVGCWSRLRVATASVSIVRLFPDRRDEVAVAGAPSEGWGRPAAAQRAAD